MNKPRSTLVVVTLGSALMALPLSAALAQQPPAKHDEHKQAPRSPGGSHVGVPGPQGGARVGLPPAHVGTPQGGARVGLPPAHVGAGPQGPNGAGQRLVRGPLPEHSFRGQAYHGRYAWERGQWHHERHHGRLGWWWDVGGVWYFYPERVDGPPVYVSDVEVPDAVYADPDEPVAEEDMPPAPVVGGYAPPPPPGQDTVGGAIGGAILGGILGGVVSGRPGGALAGALIGGTTGAAIASEAERRRGYYWWRGGCYYRYPSGEYVGVQPGYCQ